VLRRLVAVMMLAILIFNSGGYFALYYVLEARAEALLAARIENQEVGGDERFEVKLPFELPYPVRDQVIELSTPVTAGGQAYSILEQSYEDNVLTLVGVRDQWALHVDAVMNAYNDATSHSTDDDLIHSIGALLQTFVNSELILLVKSDAWAMTLHTPPASHALADGTSHLLIKPPCA
jgi:hypothetical protein